MKNNYLLLIPVVLCLIIPDCTGQTQMEVQARKIKIITTSDQTILTKNVTISDSGIVVTNDDAKEFVGYDNIDFIYIKEGGSYPKLLLYCTVFGLGYGVVWGLLSVSQTFLENVAIGLAAGVISSFILAPFITKPEKLVYYKGKWNDNRYAPGES
jgi:hypothetical protein